MITAKKIAAEIAAELKEHPEHWTQGAYAKLDGGKPCDVTEPEARYWCILGLIGKRLPIGASILLQDRIAAGFINAISEKDWRADDFKMLSRWNDRHGRTVQDVISLCERVTDEQ